MKMQCHGGRFDGAWVSSVIRSDFLWTNGKRCYQKNGMGLALYRKAYDMRGETILLYAGNAYVVCGGCGSTHSRFSDVCALCGTPLIASA